MDPLTTPVSNDQQVTFDFVKEKEQYDRIIAAFKDETQKVLERRKIRENKRNVLEERKKGTILEDETIIPDRTINTNIRQGRGPYINYITQSERLLIVTSVDAPKTPLESLETWFTKGMRYPKWKLPWFKAIDCMHTHGGCALEVMYDETKPFHCSIEYIPRSDLIFPLKTKNLQACPRLLRKYELTVLELEEYAAKYGFDEKGVKKVLDQFTKRDDFIKVYRPLLKKDGVVYNAWYVQEVDDWLRPPIPHDIGLYNFDPQMLTMDVNGVPLFLSPGWGSVMMEFAIPLQLKEYPIYWYPYEVTENEVILETSGRVALDLHVQEALTETMTSTVNGCTRASKLYASAEEEPGADPQLRELGRIKHGGVMSHKVKIMEFPWPNTIILAVMQAMGLGNAQDAGHSDFAAMARKDANKTATELNVGVQQSQEIKSSDMDIFSSPVLDTLVCCFNIACHQAIFLTVPRPTHPELLIGVYECQPAGDVEVTKRLKDDQNAKEIFNIVKGTPLGEQLLFFLIKRFFPDQADEWLASIQGPDKNAIIIQLVTALESVPTDELTPDQISALRNVIAAARAVVESSGNQSPPGSPAQTEGQPPAPSNAVPETAGQSGGY